LCEKTQTFKIDSGKKITKKKLLTSFMTVNSNGGAFNGLSNNASSGGFGKMTTSSIINVNKTSTDKFYSSWNQKQRSTPPPTPSSYSQSSQQQQQRNLERTYSASYGYNSGFNGLSGFDHRMQQNGFQKNVGGGGGGVGSNHLGFSFNNGNR
jgi:hypothetical protein